MIGYGFKKYANELGFNIKEGIGYGEYKGYLLTFQEGAGWKSVTIAAVFDTSEARLSLQNMLLEKNFKKKYRITQCDIIENMANIIFLDNPGTLKRIRAVVDIICDHLSSNGVKGVGNCAECGHEIIDGGIRMVMHGAAVEVHSGCADRIEREINDVTEENRRGGSILMGTVGAILGGIIGAIPWAIISYLGFITSIAGLIIGYCSSKGYDLLYGKRSLFKLFIVIVVSLLSIVGAEYIAYVAVTMSELQAMPELAGMSLSIGDAASFLNMMIVTEEAIRTPFITDVALGWLFAAIGLIPNIRGIIGDAKVQNGITRL